MTISMCRRDLMKSAGLGALAFSLGGAISPSVLGQEPPGAGHRPYRLPPLPYEYGALAPGIEERVIRVHHGKHHAGYVRGLDETLKQLEQARVANDFSTIKPLSRALAFHGSGHVLHTLHWRSMTPGGSGDPTGRLRETLERDFGSFEAFRDQFKAAANKVEGSGWAVLAYEPMGARLLILQAEKHQNLTIWGVAPLSVCDVWEHAYYVQYQNRRAEYVDNFFNLIDWPAAARRYAAAMRWQEHARMR